MPSISCGAYNCIYNASKACVATDIHVRGGATNSVRRTSCNTFSDNPSEFVMSALEHMSAVSLNPDKTLPHTAMHKMDMEMGGEISGTTHTSCSAVKCRFNNDYSCDAKTIKISGNDVGSTHCLSFTK